MTPKLIYMAGPYRAKTLIEVERNILTAKWYGTHVAQAGGYPVIPHANTDVAFTDLGVPDEFWLAATLKLLQRCDGIFLLPQWKLSAGARAEKAEADRTRMPCYEYMPEHKEVWHIESLRKWLTFGDAEGEFR